MSAICGETQGVLAKRDPGEDGTVVVLQWMRPTRTEAMNFYVTGGTLRSDAPSYVEREADGQLYDGLLHGEFCYVLTARQMGKSSLMVRTASRLRAKGVHVVVMDLTALGGQNVTPQQWYFSLLDTLGQALDLGEELEEFWRNNGQFGPLHLFMRSIRQIVLPRLQEREERMANRAVASSQDGTSVAQFDDQSDGLADPKVRLVIFVDEIDFVRSLPFSTDEFFAAIRECYNHRPLDPAYERLTFCLLGVATPSDLIRDTRTTPFNIGRRIELNDFTVGEAAPLVEGLREVNRKSGNSGRFLIRILYWTSGHPYLTQRLCRATAEAMRGTRTEPDAGRESPARLVDRLCADLFFSTRARERDDNLIFVRERLLRSEADRASLLDLYLKVWQGKPVMDDEVDSLISLLRLSGIVRVSRGRLYERNRIYDHVFDREWVRSNLPEAELRRQREAYRRGVIWGTTRASIAILALVLLSLVAVDKTSESNLAQAKAWRVSGRMGQRIEALNALQRAKRWGIFSRDPSVVRNEAISAINLMDLVEQHPGIESVAEHTTEPELNPAFSAYAVGEQDGRIAVLNIATRSVELRLPSVGLPVAWLQFSPHERLLAAQYGREGETACQFIVWSLASGSRLFELQEWLSRGEVDFSRDGSRLAVCPRGRQLCVYELGGGGPVLYWRPESEIRIRGPVSCIRFDPSGKQLAQYSESSLYVFVWEIGTETVKSYRHPQGVVALDWSPSGHQLATVCQNGDVYLWNLPLNEKNRLYHSASDVVRADVRFNRMGTILAAICADSALRLWRPHNGQQILSASDFDDSARLGFDENDRWLSVTKSNRQVRLLEVIGGRELVTFRGQTDIAAGFDSIGFDTTGRVLIAAGRDAGVWLWDVDDPQVFATASLIHPTSVGFDSKRPALLVSTEDGFFRVPWSQVGRSGRSEIRLETPQCLDLPRGLNRVVLATNGTGAVIHVDKSYDHVHVFPMDKPEENFVLAAHRQLDSLALTPDGTWLAASTAPGGKVLVWGLREPNVQSHYRELPGSRYLAFSPSGKWLVTSCTNEIQFRKTGSWKLDEQLSIRHSQNSHRFTPIAFGQLRSAGECLMAVAVSPNKIRIFRFWDRDVARTEALAELTSPSGVRVSSLALNSFCTRLAAASEDGLIQVWNLATIREDLAARGLAAGFPEIRGSAEKTGPIVFQTSEPTEVDREAWDRHAGRWTYIELHTRNLEAERSEGSDRFSDLYGRANLYRDLKRYDKAFRDYTEALELRPDDDSLRRAQQRVRQLLDSGQPATAATNPTLNSVKP